MPPRRTGMHRADAQDDFLRARRQRALARLRRTFERPGDIDVILPFDEVVAALGRLGERNLGAQVVPLDTILGTVDRPHGFDREFRPTSSSVRTRWERVAAARRRGEPLPPVELYRVGEVHFVRDGHHRVSVARALGDRDIEARVTEILTRVGAERTLRVADLPLKSHERLFAERVPLAADARSRMRMSDPLRLGELAENVEAWGFRLSQEEGRLLDREEAARRWYDEEFCPVAEVIAEAGLRRSGETEADAYLRLASERYRVLYKQGWDEEALAAVTPPR